MSHPLFTAYSTWALHDELGDTVPLDEAIVLHALDSLERWPDGPERVPERSSPSNRNSTRPAACAPRLRTARPWSRATFTQKSNNPVRRDVLPVWRFTPHRLTYPKIWGATFCTFPK